MLNMLNEIRHIIWHETYLDQLKVFVIVDKDEMKTDADVNIEKI